MIPVKKGLVQIMNFPIFRYMSTYVIDRNFDSAFKDIFYIEIQQRSKTTMC